MKRTRICAAATLFLLAGTVGTAQAQRTQTQGKTLPAQRTQAQGKTLPHTATVPPAEQRQRVQQQQQRATQYKQHLTQQVRVVQQQTTQLQKQKRTAQYRVQQQYTAQLEQQQKRLPTARNYAKDPYVTAPLTYRYNMNGTTRQTNQYGANVLRQAVNYGYQEGLQSGQADHQDNWPSNYQNSTAYQDANYGYNGSYVDQTDYNYYFRQGFQRGYQDGYGNTSQYGTSSNGVYSILSSVLSSILGLQPIG